MLFTKFKALQILAAVTTEIFLFIERLIHALSSKDNPADLVVFLKNLFS